jgi:hypothetical protein
MFGWNKRVDLENEEFERERLKQMTEKELLIEMIVELKRIDVKCDDIARKIVIWSD